MSLTNLRVGTVARCGLGTLGLILNDKPQAVSYEDGTTGEAWVGIHLSAEIAPVGSPWSSRNPEVVGQINLAEVIESLGGERWESYDKDGGLRTYVVLPLDAVGKEEE